MNVIQRFQAALQAFKTPERGQSIVRTSNTQSPSYKQPETLTWKQRKQILRNPSIYSAMRNTTDELIGKWNGAAGYIPQDQAEEHLRRPAQILAASKDPRHIAQADHLCWNIDQHLKRGWDDVLKQLLNARKHGKSIQEIKWSRQPSGRYRGTWVIDDILDCDSDCFAFRYDKISNPLTGETEYQRVLLYDPNASAYNGKPVRPEKFLVYTFDRERENDEGESLLTKLDLLDWYWRNNFTSWMVDLHRYGSPLVVGKVPRYATDEQRDRLLAVLNSIQQETGIVINEDDTIELLQAQRNGASGFDLLNGILEKLIAVVVTGHSAGLTNDQYGTLGQAKVTTAEIRMILLYALAGNLDSVINRQLIYWWMTFNYPSEEMYPRQQILPPRAEEVTNPVSPVVSMEKEPPSTVAFSQKTESRTEELLIQNALKQSFKAVQTVWIAPILETIKHAAAPADVSKKLSKLGSQIDTSAYQNVLHQSLLTGSILGFWQVQRDLKDQAQFAADDIDQLLQSPLEIDRARELVLAKKIVQKRVFEQLDDYAKRQAFTIAGVEHDRIMQAIKEAVAEAIQENSTIAEIEIAAMQAFHRYGITDQISYHAETVFRTNICTALNDAQWEALESPDNRDAVAFLQYETRFDLRVRDNHAKMHGVIRPPDDPIWKVWWPPNGYNCRCSIRAISKAEADRRGLQPTPNLPGAQPDEGFAAGPGKRMFVEEGIHYVSRKS
jgi:SPP1 gp7 family putative phage head morphogenesis protein